MKHILITEVDGDLVVGRGQPRDVLSIARRMRAEWSDCMGDINIINDDPDVPATCAGILCCEQGVLHYVGNGTVEELSRDIELDLEWINPNWEKQKADFTSWAWFAASEIGDVTDIALFFEENE